MSVLCAKFLIMQMGDINQWEREVIESVIAPGHYLHGILEDCKNGVFGSTLTFNDRFATYLRVADEPLIVDGERYDLFSLQLNSALAWGNRAVQMAAKLHAQCEIHAYCEGVNRGWLADIIAEGMECNVFRDGRTGYDGWQKVIEFLRSSSIEPVVTSYSVCESFPGPHCAPEGMAMGDDPWETWDALPPSTQWQLGMDHVRAEGGLEISPERLGKRFMHGLSGRELMDVARAKLAEKEGSHQG